MIEVRPVDARLESESEPVHGYRITGIGYVYFLDVRMK